MKNIRLIRLLSGLLFFTLGLATGLNAQMITDASQRIEQKRTDLAGAPGMEVVASIVVFKPGESGELHFHQGVETFYVLQGASVQALGKDPVMLPTGVISLNLRNAKHGAFKVVGDTSLKMFTVHVVDKGKPLYDYSK